MTTDIVAAPPVSDVIRLVLDGLISPRSKAAYNAALTRFLEWREEVGNPPFSKRLVQRYRVELIGEGYAPATVNVALSAIRKLALEAGDNGYLDPNIAAAIGRVPGVRQSGRRVGNWLDKEEAAALLDLPDSLTLIGKRDRALLGILLCGLRRSEAVALTVKHFRLVGKRWIIADLVGKGLKMRSVPIPDWVKDAVDVWLGAAGIKGGYVFRRVRAGGRMGKGALSDRSVYGILAKYAEGIAPHDLRRTFSKLAYAGGAPLTQISLTLGHSSLKTTELYLGLEQNLTRGEAPCDFLGLGA